MKPSVRDFVNHDEGVFKYPALLPELVPVQLAHELCEMVPCTIVEPYYFPQAIDVRLRPGTHKVTQDPYQALGNYGDKFFIGLQGYFGTTVNTAIYFGGEIHLFQGYGRITMTERADYNLNSILLPVAPVIFPLVRSAVPDDIPDTVYERLLQHGYGIHRYLFITIWKIPSDAYYLNALLAWLRFKQTHPEVKPLIYSGEMATPIIHDYLREVVETYNRYIEDHPDDPFLPGEVFMKTKLAQRAARYVPRTTVKRFECAYRWAVGDMETYERECTPERLEEIEHHQILIPENGRYVEKRYTQVIAAI